MNQYIADILALSTFKASVFYLSQGRCSHRHSLFFCWYRKSSFYVQRLECFSKDFYLWHADGTEMQQNVQFSSLIFDLSQYTTLRLAVQI